MTAEAVFLKHYNLAENPFAPRVARPLLNSLSVRQAATEIQAVVEGTTHFLLLSGAGGVGKTTLIRQKMRDTAPVTSSWVNASTATGEAFFKKLLSDLGLEGVDGSLTELRKITEVFLSHQVGQNRRAVLVADGLESVSVSVLRELDWLAGLRLRGRPLLGLILSSRSEELLLHVLPSDPSGRLVRHVLARLTGFALDETRTYIYLCLHEAGCRWGEELIPEDAIVDIQAFSQGIVADVNNLCFGALNQLAERVGELDRPPRVSRLLLKEVGAKQGLRYDALTRQLLEESLTPEAIYLSPPGEARTVVASLCVTSGGRTVAEVKLDRPRIVLGRDKSCDVSLNSNYVSRYQNLFMQTPEGWILLDLNSTNGSFVNGRRVREHRLRDGDVIAVGIHQLRFSEASGATAPSTETRIDVAPKPPSPEEAATMTLPKAKSSV